MTVTEQTLHPDEDLTSSGDWFACSEPERPADDRCVYEEDCPKCIIKAEADLAAGIDGIYHVHTNEAWSLSAMIANFYAGSAS